MIIFKIVFLFREWIQLSSLFIIDVHDIYLFINT
jgi:hypothetical protein